MPPELDRHRRETRAEGRHPSQTRTIVADTGREPDEQNGRNSGPRELEAVGDHARIAHWHVRAVSELGHVEAAQGPKLVSNARRNVDGLPCCARELTTTELELVPGATGFTGTVKPR